MERNDSCPDWAKFLSDFLVLFNYPILADVRKITVLKVKLKAEVEYKVYRKRQDSEYVSDFDREVKRLEFCKKE
jgi:hypothetical protein